MRPPRDFSRRGCDGRPPRERPARGQPGHDDRGDERDRNEHDRDDRDDRDEHDWHEHRAASGGYAFRDHDWHGHGRHGHGGGSRYDRWHDRRDWHFRGAPLHRRIFRWFWLSMFLTAGAAAAVFKIIGHSGPSMFVALFAAGAMLWLVSLSVARKLGRPLQELITVTREIGEGNLKSRARLRWHEPGEVGALAEAINEMAARIEKQLGDQRELVAAVSHEIRAPLSRLRVMVEILRGRGVDGATLGKLDREIVEIDSLVGDLLASSRLEFSLLTFHSLDARAVAAEALERAELGETPVTVTATDTAFEGDPTLLARALANLLDNAVRHGEGPTALVVRGEGPDQLVFEVLDSGPGIAAELLPRMFEPFQRGQEGRRGSTSLGLGLSLVLRIAKAHGGVAWAENRAEGGARVALRLTRFRPDAPP